MVKLSSVLLFFNSLILLFIWVFTAFNFVALPETIPTHFTINGTVNGEGNKNSIWILPVISTFIFLMLVSIPKNPDSPLLNVPKSFRNTETLKLYMYSMLFPVMLLLGDTVMESILVSKGKLNTMTDAVFFILALLFGVFGISIFKMIKGSKAESLNN